MQKKYTKVSIIDLLESALHRFTDNFDFARPGSLLLTGRDGTKPIPSTRSIGY